MSTLVSVWRRIFKRNAESPSSLGAGANRDLVDALDELQALRSAAPSGDVLHEMDETRRSITAIHRAFLNAQVFLGRQEGAPEGHAALVVLNGPGGKEAVPAFTSIERLRTGLPAATGYLQAAGRDVCGMVAGSGKFIVVDHGCEHAAEISARRVAVLANGELPIMPRAIRLPPSAIVQPPPPELPARAIEILLALGVFPEIHQAYLCQIDIGDENGLSLGLGVVPTEGVISEDLDVTMMRAVMFLERSWVRAPTLVALLDSTQPARDIRSQGLLVFDRQRDAERLSGERGQK